MKSPAFQFYVRDWIASETVNRLHRKHPRAVSAYLFLLCHAWISAPAATLPNDHEELAAFAHVSREQWDEIWPLIEHLFSSDGNGRIYNIRQHEGFLKSQINQNNGKRGGNPNIMKNSVNPSVKARLNLSPKEKGKEKKKGSQ